VPRFVSRYRYSHKTGQSMERCRWERDFPYPSDRLWDFTKASVHGYRVSFPGLKRPGFGVNHSHSSSSKGKESSAISLRQRFSNFFQVGTTFISQNVLRTTLLLSHLKANCLRFSTIVCDTQFMLILFFLSFFFFFFYCSI
jgi:hypothetical protein